jgi:hypothetical protein
MLAKLAKPIYICNAAVAIAYIGYEIAANKSAARFGDRNKTMGRWPFWGQIDDRG